MIMSYNLKNKKKEVNKNKLYEIKTLNETVNN